ncbi:ATP-binding cassette domain-containing protein [Brachybacterium sp. EF45031]|nr:ATP-binding cassette domain-containing protein [Brachybacterium sillae]
MLCVDHLRWTPLGRSAPTLDDVTVRIGAGERVLLVGASGSGKSTLLRALAGLLDPEAGELSGHVTPPGRSGACALLLQNPAHAMVGATAARDTAFGPENLALGRAAIQQRVTAAHDAAAVDLPADRAPVDASGGQQQRLALAGALSLEPEALLLDEPTAMLDAPTATAVRQAVLETVGPRTLVVADHHAEAWLPQVHRVIVLGPQGRVLADTDPDTARDRYPELLGLSAAPAAEALRRSLCSPGTRPDAGAAAGPVVLRARGLRVARTALDGLDLTLHAGTLTAVTGPSGAGKTSLLRVLLGLSRPALGSVERPTRVAFVPQDPESSFVARTVDEEARASVGADPELAQRLLRTTGLDALAAANPYTLSGGEQRRLAIVAALASRPQLLVLDEPTVGLDDARARDILDLVEEARDSGAAVIAGSHDPRLIDRAGQQVTVPAPPPTPGAADTTLRPVSHQPSAPSDRLNPLTAIVIATLSAVGSLAVDTWQIGLLSLLPMLLLAPLTIRTLRGTLLRLLPAAVGALGLAWSTMLLSDATLFSPQAWAVSAKEGLRIWLFVAPGVLALTGIDPTALGDALGGRLRLPARPIAAMVVGLVRISQVQRHWLTITQTRELRGLGPQVRWRHPWRSLRSTIAALSGSTLALLVQEIRGAEQSATAMDARGFATAQRRTWALPSRFTGADGIGLAAGMLLMAWPFAMRAILGG